jgi:hypothetical protein
VGAVATLTSETLAILAIAPAQQRALRGEAACPCSPAAAGKPARLVILLQCQGANGEELAAVLGTADPPNREKSISGGPGKINFREEIAFNFRNAHCTA